MAELYFAYGSNMSSARLLARVGGARALGAAALRHHRLVFDKPGRDGTAKANLRPTPDAVTHGVLWELAREALVVLDGFEPGYRRVRLVVEAPRDARPLAWTYVHPGAVEPLQPSHEYVAHLVDGAREHGLPEEAHALLEGVIASLGRTASR